MKQTFFSFLLTLLPIVAIANAVEIDGIYYNLVNKVKTAEVTWNSNKYMGAVTIPETVTYNDITYYVTSIGEGAFYDCSSLKAITIPNSVTTIGDLAFSDCSSLTNITIPNSVTSIENYAFNGCSSLTSITIPNSVTSIGNKAFSNCRGLMSIDIPNSVISIGESAFSNCSGLMNITIGNSVATIGHDVFQNCTSLSSIQVEKGNRKYDSRDECNAIIETATNTLVCGCQNTVVPNSVTSIWHGAFYNCSGLTSVIIPQSVTYIGYDVFEGCSGLTSIQVEEGNNEYDSREGCNAIIETATNKLVYGCQNTTIPNSVTSIGDAAFFNCSGLTSIIIPKSVTYIGSYAFRNCI